ncbi:MAG: lysophospholipase [Acidimicrobiia bacterium]|nr:lysophospholipase [Acidimicrobiia bacterium]
MRPRFSTVDDVLLAGRHWLTEPPPLAAVVLVHGFSATAGHPEVSALADTLHATGLDVVSYDARGHGDSEGHSTLGDLEQHDVAAAVAVARARAERVVLVGASMGAIAALRYAATDPELAGVVAVSCPSRWRLPRNPHGVLAAGLTRTGLGRALAARYLRVRVASRWTNPLPPVDLVPRVRSPIALVHGTRDRFIPVGDAHELFAQAGPARRLDVVPGMGHAFEAAALAPIVDAVAWTLAPSPARAQEPA